MAKSRRAKSPPLLRYEMLNKSEQTEYLLWARRFDNPKYKGDSEIADEEYAKAQEKRWEDAITAPHMYYWRHLRSLVFAMKGADWFPWWPAQDGARSMYKQIVESLLVKYKCDEVDWDTFPVRPWRIDFAAEEERIRRLTGG